MRLWSGTPTCQKPKARKKMTDRQFTHPHFGSEARVEVHGREVRLIFVSSSEEKAEEFAERCLDQLKQGSLNLTVMGRVTSVEDE